MRALTCVSSAFLAAFLLQAAPASLAKETATTGTPSATLELKSEKMRLISGGTGGKGTLHFQGKDYAFTYKSSSAGVGAKAVTSVTATGNVYGLTKIEDFPGRYSAMSKAANVGAAQVTAKYKGDHDVVIVLNGTVKGAGLTMGAGIATIKLVEEPKAK
jgi:hypothetical protein